MTKYEENNEQKKGNIVKICAWCKSSDSDRTVQRISHQICELCLRELTDSE